MRPGWIALLVAGIAACGAGEAPPAQVLDAATTTSVRDSGLFDELLPIFLEQTGIEVRLVAVGSGAALRMGGDGDVDVLVTHAPEGERELVAAGRLVDRRAFMENHFVLAGPPDDPAGMAEALAGFITARERWPTMREAGHAHVAQAHDWARNIDRYRAVYQNLLARDSSAVA